jgi:hypothetical protein
LFFSGFSIPILHFENQQRKQSPVARKQQKNRHAFHPRREKTSQELPLWNVLSSHLNLFRQERRSAYGIRIRKTKMAERPVLVGLIPQTVVLDPGDQVSWISDAGNLRVEFDVNRCPFSSNVFQAPAGIRLLSGPPRPGSKAATYKYRLWLNDQLVGHGEVILRDK